jgi:hypothetical protein
VAESSVLNYNSGPELWPSFRAVFVETAELDGASVEDLRARFREMRQGDDFPKGIRTSCFLVADKEVIESEAAQVPYVPKYEMDMTERTVRIEPDDPVVYIRAVDPDNQATVAAIGAQKEQGEGAKEEDDGMAGFTGEATVALPRVFDWLHYVCFCAERGISNRSMIEHHNDQTWITGWAPVDRAEGWRTIHIQTRSPKSWVRNWAPNTGSVEYATVYGITQYL